MSKSMLSYIQNLKNGTQQVQYIPDYFSSPMIKMFAETADGTKYCFTVCDRSDGGINAYPTFAALAEGVGSAFSTEGLPLGYNSKPWIELNSISPQTPEGYTGEYIILAANEFDMNIINAKLSETNLTFDDFINNP